jgi:tripartite-type tricarboxylate transporter receptor subunit TctC
MHRLPRIALAFTLAGVAVAVLHAGLAAAQPAEAWPARPIRIIVPFPPAGATDILARAVAFDLQKAFSQTVVGENRPGAGGNLGADMVAKAAPDGYTLLMATVGTHAINVALYAKMPYDAVRDFAPVSLVALVPNLLVVHPSLPVHSVSELIAWARAHPGKLNYASSGNGTSIHLSGELFKSMAALEITHVPYKGSGPAIADLIGGQVQLMFDNLPSALPHARGGKLRALAVTSARRSPAAPELPTVAEAGLPGYEASAWFGIAAPAATPREIVSKLNAAIARGLQSNETRERLSGQGAEPVGGSPEQFAEHIRTELAKWAKVVKASGARVD